MILFNVIELKTGTIINASAGLPKKRACVGLVNKQLFFGLNFFAYFLFSRKESKNQRRSISRSNNLY
jgi:hypothetical protein